MSSSSSAPAARLEWLNYHHLLCFWLVARRGGLQAAGRELFVSASTVWAQLKAVEARLGVQLLVRKGRRLELTPTGERVAQVADEIFSLGREVLAIARGTEHATRPLKVGVVATLPRLLTKKFLAPGLSQQRVFVVHGPLERLLGELAGHQLDVVLSDETPAPDGPVKVYAHPLGASKLAWYCTPELKARLLPGYPGSLEQARLLLPPEGAPQRHALAAALARLKVRPTVAAEVDDSALLKALAADGHGVMAAPVLVAAELERVYGLVPLATSTAREAYFALTLHQRLEHPGVEAMLQT